MPEKHMAGKHIDQLSGVETTGHEWDGIRELNNPLPRWWLWTFYACILWSVGYAIAYPSIPLLTDATKGLLRLFEPCRACGRSRWCQDRPRGHPGENLQFVAGRDCRRPPA
jgi:hypothetical protein